MLSYRRSLVSDWTLTKCGHVFTSLDRLEANEGHLHTGKGADGVPRAVSNVHPVVEATHEDEDEHMERDHVCDEGVST